MENGRGKATKLAQELGCSTQTSREMVDCLRHRPASMIVQQVGTFQVNPAEDDRNTSFLWCGFSSIPNLSNHVRFDLFTAVTKKNGVFWDLTPCGSCKNGRFGGT
jgi:hypothetical protein